MDPVFLPRTLIHVERLPRSELGKLPRAALDALHARRNPAHGARAPGSSAPSVLDFAFAVAGDHPCLPGHFPGRPVVPGVLLLDRVFDAVQRRTGRAIARVQRAKFTAALLPDEPAQCHCGIDGARMNFRVTVARGGAPVLVAEGAATLSVETVS
nr:hypothetical protein [Caenimonas aquaedulcis]